MRSNIFIALCGVIFISNHLFSDSTEGWDAGRNFGSQVRTEYGTNIKSTLVEPMTNSDRQFSTMDGNQSFTANMTCGDEARSFMTVSYNLGSPRNGVVPVVAIDKNLDGVKEYSFTSPHTASAVCSNGIAVCPSGNFSAGNSCTYYKWAYNGTNLSLVAADANTMSACQCINDTCGSTAQLQRDSLIGTIATSIYSVISAFSATYIISDTQINSGTAEYFGQRTDTCSNFQGTVATTGTSTTIDSSAELIGQSSNPKSSYSALLGTSQNYSVNSPNVSTQVTTSKDASRSVRSNIAHEDGTTDFTARNYSTGASINGHVGIPLTSDDDLYCQVQWLGTSNEVFTDSTERSEATSSGSQWQTETRLCIGGVCPYSSTRGESIKHDCGNINNFAEAASAFTALQELADDITCGSI